MGERKEGAWSHLLAAGLAQTDDFRGGGRMVIGTRPLGYPQQDGPKFHGLAPPAYVDVGC